MCISCRSNDFNNGEIQLHRLWQHPTEYRENEEVEKCSQNSTANLGDYKLTLIRIKEDVLWVTITLDWVETELLRCKMASTAGKSNHVTCFMVGALAWDYTFLCCCQRLYVLLFRFWLIRKPILITNATSFDFRGINLLELCIFLAFIEITHYFVIYYLFIPLLGNQPGSAHQQSPWQLSTRLSLL